MKNRFSKLIFTSFLAIFLFSTAYASYLSSPVGYWWQVSDKTGKVHSIIRIFKTGNTLSGRVVRAFKQNGQLPKEYCTKCTGRFKGKKIMKINIIWGMKYDSSSGRWEDGHILDPDSGDVYKSNMVLINGGWKLKVRGYIGISLFGRSQVWNRIPKSKLKAALKTGYPKSKK